MTIKKSPVHYLKFGTPVLILLFLVFLTKTNVFQQSPAELSIGILLDLLITIPLLYVFLIRKTSIPKFTIIYPFMLGLVVAGFIIPAEHQQLLSFIKSFAVPVIELGLLGLLIYKIASINKSYKKASGKDFYDKLLLATEEVFPNRLGKIMATEIAVIYYLLSFGKRQKQNNHEFAYHEKSGIQLTIGVLLFLIVIETFVIHFLVAKWSAVAAWIISLIGAYTILQVVAILRSMQQRPIFIDHENNCLELRYGFGCQTSISFDSIIKVDKSSRTPADKAGHVCLSLFDLIDSNNIILYLNQENTLQKIYGISKKYISISLFVDKKDLFAKEIEQIIANN